MPDYYCEECEVTIVRDGKNRHIKTNKHIKNVERNKRNKSIFLAKQTKNDKEDKSPVENTDTTIEELVSKGINVEITYSVKKDGDKVVKFKF